MHRNLDDLKTEIERLPKEREIKVVYKADTLKQIMGLLRKKLILLK